MQVSLFASNGGGSNVIRNMGGRDKKVTFSMESGRSMRTFLSREVSQVIVLGNLNIMQCGKSFKIAKEQGF